MKIAIHHTEGSFSEFWIRYCKVNNINYKIVDCYDHQIIQHLKSCDVLMWHYQHTNYRDILFAKELLFSVEQMGLKVFPDYNTAWHFDDKIGQKYLLESVNAPLVPSFVFYEKQKALEWSRTTVYPKVFKLRGGAGGANVKLIKSQQEATRLIKKSFGRGFAQYDKLGGLKDRINKFRSGSGSFRSVLGGLSKFFISNDFEQLTHKEKGYFYVQEFIPDNDFDIRVIVIGNKAFAVKRIVRNNDFRASGSGQIVYGKDIVEDNTLRIAFNVAGKLKTQCCAFDFVFDSNNDPLIVEISYGFSPEPYFKCNGYWCSKLKWHEVNFNPQYWMIEDILNN